MNHYEATRRSCVIHSIIHSNLYEILIKKERLTSFSVLLLVMISTTIVQFKVISVTEISILPNPGNSCEPRTCTNVSHEHQWDRTVQEMKTLINKSEHLNSNTSEDLTRHIKWQQERTQGLLLSSPSVIQGHLVEAHSNFRRMMQENKTMASGILTARHQLSILQEELAVTRRQLIEKTPSGVAEFPSDTSNSVEVASMAGNVLTTCVPAGANNGPSPQGAECNTNISQNDNSPPSPNSNTSSNCPNQFVSVNVDNITGKKTISQEKNLPEKEKSESHESKSSANSVNNICEQCKGCKHRETNNLEEKLAKLQEENDRLSQLNKSLYREVEELQDYKKKMNSGGSNEKSSDVQHLETDLKHAKEALAALKHDRKRLKVEKFDLLNQMKQLYSTLEDKEKELRDFIRNYEQRMKQSDENLKQLVRAKEECEIEKWSILKHARDETEKSVTLSAQLELKESQLRQMKEELNTLQDKTAYSSDADSTCTSNIRTNGHLSPTNTNPTTNGKEGSDVPTSTATSESTFTCPDTPTITVDSDTSPSHCEPSSPQAAATSVVSALSRSAEEMFINYTPSDDRSKKNRKRRDGKGSWGSISKVFTRGRQRRALDSGMFDTENAGQVSPQSNVCISPITEDVYAEKVKLLEDAQGISMEKWKAATVRAWIEISLGMPQYGAMCAENVKSGKILLELSDAELEAGLGINNGMHRRKLRLAIEEHREPSLCSFPKIYQLSHVWVADDWVPSLGLSLYCDNFARQLVDGRVLNTLSKKDLEKYLGISRKFHQVSILHGIQLLRMVKFDLQLLLQRRAHCEHMDVDPLVWTNQRFIKWTKSIDLVEYAENLVDSGVHGALVVLEPSFTADTMATALGIPASKNIIRRHLTTELENLIQPARLSLEAEAFVNTRKSDKRSTGSSGYASLGRNFNRSHSRGTLERVDKERSSMKLSVT
ncbi:kazrin-like isoform X2 [Tachypleus tridentatus]|uniref:kazrin-like isoform X2 n=1 Tax=Tachypleus tridentatus TaxID=6853 RepID=UPI003FCF524C